MIEEPVEQQVGPYDSYRKYLNYRFIGGITVLLVISGLIGEWLNMNGILSFQPGMLFIAGVMLGTAVACCMSLITLGNVAAKMPEYGDMEILFEEGKHHYDNREWNEAIIIFEELMGPHMDHKRALYYAAKSYEQLDNWQMVKKYCLSYIEMQPKDKEVWELLATAHKRLFEYEAAEMANEQAAKLK